MTLHNPLTEEQLAEMQERCDKATPGPWMAHGEHRFVHQDGGDYRCICESSPFLHSHHGYENPNFIAHARADLPAALAEIRRCWAEIDRLRSIEHRHNLLLLERLQMVRHEGEGPNALYFSDGLQVSVENMLALEAAGLFVRVGSGPDDRIFGKLTAEGVRMMGGGE